MDLTNPLVSKYSDPLTSSSDHCGGNPPNDNDHFPNSDEMKSYHKLSSPSGHSSYPHHYKYSPSYSSDTGIDGIDTVDIQVQSEQTKFPDIDPDILPNDVLNDDWQCAIQVLLDFSGDIDDDALALKIRNLSYSVRSSQLELQQMVESLPHSIANEIISYELSQNSVEIFVRRSMVYNVLNKFNIAAFISQWILTFIGLFKSFIGLNLFHLLSIIPSTKSVYFIGNYTTKGCTIELSIITVLFSIHLMCILGVYNTGRKWSKKLNRIKKVLYFADAENCGEAYIPALKWLGFPFIETFNLNLKWFILLGFKYWIMIVVFIVLCLPFWVFEMRAMWLIISIPCCVLCVIGAWLQLVTFQNTINTVYSAIKELIKIFIMCLIIFAMLYGIMCLIVSHHDGNDILNDNNTLIFDGNFAILNVMLALMFFVVLLYVELKIIRCWKSVNVRYNYFAWQLVASIIIVMIFGILELKLLVLMSITFVMYNAAIIWNDLMHKKIMQTTYGVNAVEYVNKYRPIYNTDRDSEWLTTVFTLCCSKKHCISKCRGRWVINCYAGLVTGTITTPEYVNVIII